MKVRVTVTCTGPFKSGFIKAVKDHRDLMTERRFQASLDELPATIDDPYVFIYVLTQEAHQRYVQDQKISSLDMTESSLLTRFCEFADFSTTTIPD